VTPTSDRQGPGDPADPADPVDPVDPAGSGRDRDAAGRPRNARPRDGLGRPLDRAATGQPTLPDDLRLTAPEALEAAQRLIDEGRPFHAHEVLELAWKAAQEEERGTWKGLAQIAVGLTHARRGNEQGAVTLLRRGADGVGGVGHQGGPPAGFDPAGVAARARDLADRIEQHGLGAVPDKDLRLDLVR
jgi:hypothetical protein